VDPSRTLKVIRSLAGKVDDGVIRAYHGSPHSFSRFDASKIGTGEGAQAYGHGLYFAGNEDVARSYRDIAPAIVSPEHQAEIMELQSQYLRLVQEGQRISDAMSRIHESRGVTHPGWGNLRSVPADDPELSALRSRLAGVREMTDAAAAKTASAMSARGMRPPRGHMYEVEIDYPEEALLDWDKPLWSQSDSVTAGLRRVDPRVFGATPEMRAGAYGGWLWKTPRNTLLGNPDPAASPELLSFWDTHKGSRHAGAAFADLEAMAQSRANASAALRDAGIPGIRYLDQGSRSAGEGTRNYVMFPGTEDRIRILRQYGLLAPIALQPGEE